jgi:hypothetical protein
VENRERKTLYRGGAEGRSRRFRGLEEDIFVSVSPGRGVRVVLRYANASFCFAAKRC